MLPAVTSCFSTLLESCLLGTAVAALITVLLAWVFLGGIRLKVCHCVQTYESQHSVAYDFFFQTKPPCAHKDEMFVPACFYRLEC